MRGGRGMERKGEGGTLLNLDDHSPLGLGGFVYLQRVYSVPSSYGPSSVHTHDFTVHGEVGYRLSTTAIYWYLWCLWGR